MIEQRYRFHGHNAIQYVYRHGRSVRGSSLSLRFVANTRDGYRAAVVVSRKVHKSAVVRNRIRRRIYEIIRRQGLESVSASYVVITVFSDQLATCASAELEQAVSGLLRQAGLLPASTK